MGLPPYKTFGSIEPNRARRKGPSLKSADRLGRDSMMAACPTAVLRAQAWDHKQTSRYALVRHVRDSCLRAEPGDLSRDRRRHTCN
jgi:hypothetical protein